MPLAVDSSVLLDEQLDDVAVVAALEAIRWRLKDPDIFVSPSVIEDLQLQSEKGDSEEERRTARLVLINLRDRNYKPMNFIPAGHGVVEQIAIKLRGAACLPDENETDALVLAEAALLGCETLLTSSEALLGASHHCNIHDVLNESDVPVAGLVITTPQAFASRWSKSKA